MDTEEARAEKLEVVLGPKPIRQDEREEK
jgi:hypothetical protein